MRQRLGLAGQDWVRAERTWASNGARYLAAYEAIIGPIDVGHRGRRRHGIRSVGCDSPVLASARRRIDGGQAVVRRQRLRALPGTGRGFTGRARSAIPVSNVVTGPLVSVIVIPRSRDAIARHFRILQRATYRPVELLIVTDGSAPESGGADVRARSRFRYLQAALALGSFDRSRCRRRRGEGRTDLPPRRRGRPVVRRLARAPCGDDQRWFLSCGASAPPSARVVGRWVQASGRRIGRSRRPGSTSAGRRARSCRGTWPSERGSTHQRRQVRSCPPSPSPVSSSSGPHSSGLGGAPGWLHQSGPPRRIGPLPRRRIRGTPARRRWSTDHRSPLSGLAPDRRDARHPGPSRRSGTFAPCGSRRATARPFSTTRTTASAPGPARRDRMPFTTGRSSRSGWP